MESGADTPRWFAARAGNCQEIKAKEKLKKFGLEHFVPTAVTLVERRGRKVRVEKSLIGNLVFLRATKEEACALVNYRGLPLHFIPDRCGGNSMLEVPERQMEDFRRVFDYSLAEGSDPTVLFAAGDRVRITKGDLKGVEGQVLETEDGTYVAVSLLGLLQARAKIPTSFLQKL